MNSKINEQIELIKKNKVKIGGYLRESLNAIFFVWCIFIVLFAKPHVISATFGTLIIIMGLQLRIFASSHGLFTQESNILKPEGIYKLFRHPIFTSNLLLTLGVSVYSRRILIIIMLSLIHI